MMQWLTAPSLFFRRLNDDPQWIPAFVMVTALTILTTLISFPITEQLALQHVAESGITSANEAIIHSLHAGILIGIVSAPLKVAVLWAFWSGVLYGVLTFCDNTLSYRQILAIYGFAAILPALDNLLGILLNYVIGMDSITTPAGVNSSLGSLAILLPDHVNQLALDAAKEMNVSALLLAVWLAFGIAYQPRGTIAAGVAVAAGLLAVKIGLSVGVGVILRALAT